MFLALAYEEGLTVHRFLFSFTSQKDYASMVKKYLSWTKNSSLQPPGAYFSVFCDFISSFITSPVPSSSL